MKLILLMFKLVLLPVTTVSTHDNTANLSDATVYAFLANQPNGSQLVHEDLEQIHEDDLEEMDLKWQLALLSIRARRYYQRTGKKITINGSDTAGYDKTKVECFSCHKMGHFARECRMPRNQENITRNQETTKRTVNVEDTSSKAMVAIDGAGFDWSFMADEEVPTNMALMAFSDSEVHNNKSCSNTCLKNYETFKTHYDNLRIEFNKSKFDLATYKRRLASIEEQLVFYKKNEVMFCDQIAVLKRDASFKDSEINALNIHIEKLKKEKESNQIKIDNFENASKSLDKLIGSQISDNSRKGVGFESYNVVAHPPTSLFSPPTIDLSNSGLEEFQQPEFEGYGVKVSDCEEDESKVRVLKSDNVQHKPEQENKPRKASQNPKNNRTNWNEKKTQKLGMVQQHAMNNVQKRTSQREVRPVWNNAMRTNHQNFSKTRRNFAPTTILTKSGIIPINAARQSFSRAPTLVNTARPISTAAPKPFVNFVNTAKRNRVTSAVGKQGFNAVKSLACWIWRPTRNVIDHGDPQVALKDTVIFDSGCSRHITGNKSYLTDYQDYDGGFVAFAGSSKGGKITGKGKIRTGQLDFEDVYFVKELKFNIFSVSQMCDRKNSVLFTETECLILSPDFKLPDESQVMLKIPRKDNMYSFDLKNVVPSKGQTYLFAKAINDESKLWQMRLGHINFKTMNKLVKGNLVRGLPLKIFENDHTCVACQKGKQHKTTSLLDHLGKFDGKADEGFLVGYSIISKAFRVYNSRTRKVEENLAGNRTNSYAGLETNFNAGQAGKEKVLDQEYILLPLLHTSSYVPSSSKEAEPNDDAGKEETEQPACDEEGKTDDLGNLDQQVKSGDNAENTNSTNSINTASLTVNAASDKDGNFNSTNDELVFSTPITVNAASSSFGHPDTLEDHSKMINLEDTGIFDDAYDDRDGVERLTTIIWRQRMNKQSKAGLITFIIKQRRTNHKDFKNCLFACFLSQMEPKKVTQALDDASWVEAMQEEILQFKLLNAWTLVDLAFGKRVISTKWVFRNKKDQRGIVVRNKARLVAQGYRQEEGIDYDEVFAPVARIEEIRLFLADASFMDFTVYEMDVKSAFIYGTIEEEVEQRKDGIFLSQDKYVCDILKKFGFSSVKTASTPIEIHKPLSKDADETDVDIHLYRSMIGSLMYLTSSRPGIMFVVCACSRFQVQPKASHMHAVTRIFRYLKGQPTLGLWYPKDSPMDLIAKSDSDYAGASLDRKSTTGGCQFLGCRLISWQCKKQKIVANSTTEAEYIAASNCCA
ncbi:putative ribonuclease H-like domain-containing protein [Tanacetum coccineum]